VEQTGFLQSAADRGLLVGYEETAPVFGAWKTVKSPLLPFISYPYEWSFGQLKDAALHTLDVQDAALAHGLIVSIQRPPSSPRAGSIVNL